ncbi:Restriction endonuclease, type I, EcoRI, R subunit/Type III [Nostoc piscinale CENA21]|uniref:Restriction endonuclease, type I, EcoRI, R subunit/Type III n=1 Tax=Nostoc piscinale CENA21 TaxID=224013 RepID=A0A0M5MI91_9NOSO|nr:type I restriction endonuclease [Nostoc piscinale]ALF55568.1 Restriction endonuclease, type I, EcoRI, R subunit/Type III [Nostoc piscinale CENA21]
MDFVDQVRAFASTIPAKLGSIKTEEATKHFLIMPFIQKILGYDPSHPDEVMPEYDANVGAARKFKLDYAIFQNGQPAILIECKCYGTDFSKDNEWSQLFAYFMATDARIGVLTDGVIYKFYADLERPNKMDKTPFLELDLLNLNESVIRELSKLTKSAFNVNEAIIAASELKYVGGIKALLKKQVEEPKSEFVKYFFKELCPENNFVGQLKDEFTGYTQRAIKEFIREEIESLLDEATGRSKTKQETIKIETEVETEETIKQLDFTEDEREGYYIVKSILRQAIEPTRITYKDTVNYCNILLDGNTWKPIVRLYFNDSTRKKLEIFSMDINGTRTQDKVSIDNVNEIYQYADKLKAIVTAYEQPQFSSKSAAIV